MSEARLATTVFDNNGRIYTAGSTAAQIGPAAAGIGAHAWVDGIRPEPEPVEQQDPPPPEQPPDGDGAATPPAAPPEDGEQAGDGSEAVADREAPAARRGRRGGGA